MDVATTIREARLAAGLTQAQLAERSGTSQATLSAYEHDRKSPSVATLERILAAAGTRLGTAPASRPVETPSRSRLERLGDTFVDVVDLAAELPTRHARRLRYPRLAPAPETSRG